MGGTPPHTVVDSRGEVIITSLKSITIANTPQSPQHYHHHPLSHHHQPINHHHRHKNHNHDNNCLSFVLCFGFISAFLVLRTPS